jgi:hypothetical protein
LRRPGEVGLYFLIPIIRKSPFYLLLIGWCN